LVVSSSLLSLLSSRRKNVERPIRLQHRELDLAQITDAVRARGLQQLLHGQPFVPEHPFSRPAVVEDNCGRAIDDRSRAREPPAHVRQRHREQRERCNHQDAPGE